MRHLILIISLVLLGSSAAWADCKLCEGMSRVEQIMDRVSPDPLNQETIEVQDKIVWETSGLLMKALESKEFNEELARASLSLAIRVLPYDNAMMVVTDNIKAFKTHYNADRDSSLKSILEKMLKEGKVTEAQKAKLLKAYGIKEKKGK